MPELGLHVPKPVLSRILPVYVTNQRVIIGGMFFNIKQLKRVESSIKSIWNEIFFFSLLKSI